jgi:hypothetical protein
MPGTQVLYKSEKVNTKRCYLTASDTVYRGHLVCYDRDRGTAADREPERIAYVEKPAAANLHRFAGIVQQQVKGPGWVDIAMPTVFGEVHDVWTDLSTTQDTTILTVIPGQYHAGDATEGKAIGIALQTVDRSSTNGLVQAEIFPITDGLTLATAGGRGPSPALWASCPWDAMVRNPQLGYSYWNDFVGPQVVTDGWTVTQVTSGALTHTSGA